MDIGELCKLCQPQKTSVYLCNLKTEMAENTYTNMIHNSGEINSQLSDSLITYINMLENNISLNVNHFQHQNICANEISRGINSDNMLFSNDSSCK